MSSSWKWIQPISKEIFEMKYSFHRNSPEEMFNDIATVISEAETEDKRSKIKQEFYDAMVENRFIPAGRFFANAYPSSKITNYMNCYTIGVEDSMDGIFDALKEDARISKVGGGVGLDASNLRPKNAELSVGGQASGPISFLKIFDASAKTIMTGGARRAAHIALLAVDHPDIEEFITCKQGDKNKVLTQFNISVKITDKFIDAVEKDADWDLVFGGKVYKTVKAKYLYDLMSKNAFLHNEPGIFNVDTINRYNNGHWAFHIDEVNPCGEICMPKYNVCCLGAVNLIKFVVNPFEDNAYFDFDAYSKTVQTGIRFLDNALSVASYPLDKIRDNALGWRRIGLGFTGLGNIFTMMKIKYGSDQSKELSDKIGMILRDASYQESINLAKEKGPFPQINKEELMKSNFIQMLPDDMKKEINKFGIRNIALNTVAPTGTISLSMGHNCSSGIEPAFSLSYDRTIRIGSDDETKTQTVYDYAWLEYLKKMNPELMAKDLLEGNGSLEKYNEAAAKTSVPSYFVTTANVGIKDSIDIQAIFQKYIDHSISKTLNLPPKTTLEEYENLFLYAYKKGLKGFTTFNPEGSMKGILEYNEPSKKDDDEYIKRREAPTRPEELSCDIHEIMVNGSSWIVLVGKLHGSLYEIFVDENKNRAIDVSHHTNGVIKKNGKGKYSLIVKNGVDKVVVDNLAKTMDATFGSLARFISMSLRHGTPLQFIVDQLSKSRNFVGFERAVSRVLKKYIKDGEVVMTGDICPDCGGELAFKEGCVACNSCGWSKCV